LTVVFSLKNIFYSYVNEAPILKNLTLDFRTGERAVILGANGTGKSTLLSLLDGLVFPTSGKIEAFGAPLREDAFDDRSFSADFRKRVAFVFSNPDVQLFSATVWDEIAFGPLQLDLSPSEVTLIVEKQLESLRIADLRDRAPHTLSDGQKKEGRHRIEPCDRPRCSPARWTHERAGPPNAGLAHRAFMGTSCKRQDHHCGNA